jgi:hypothetical protein
MQIGINTISESWISNPPTLSYFTIKLCMVRHLIYHLPEVVVHRLRDGWVTIQFMRNLAVTPHLSPGLEDCLKPGDKLDGSEFPLVFQR